jgi:hypothetical protein
MLKSILSRGRVKQIQLPPQQSCCHYPPLSSPRHPSLPANGQVEIGNAPDPVSRPRNPVLEACTFRFLLEFVRCNSSVLWRNIRLYLLRLDALLLTSPNPTFVLEGAEEIPSSTSLYGLREWLWCNKSILGCHFRYPTCTASNQDTVREICI